MAEYDNIMIFSCRFNNDCFNWGINI
jgi:hypothetical protein